MRCAPSCSGCLARGRVGGASGLLRGPKVLDGGSEALVPWCQSERGEDWVGVW